MLAVPGMLFAAGHAKNDIPSVLNTYAAETGLKIQYGRELGVDLKMIQAAGARIREALEKAGSSVPIEETMLVVVGRGASDPDANSNVAKVMRMLWEGFGFGWGETFYSGVTFPLVEPGLRHAVKMGFKRIVVFPYFLFTGVLVSRIYRHTDIVAAENPGIEFVKAGYLNDHPLVLETFRERVNQVITGDVNMNCSLCKYRAQVLGFEAEVGAPQQSHHHHVEGVGAGCNLCTGECTEPARTRCTCTRARRRIRTRTGMTTTMITGTGTITTTMIIRTRMITRMIMRTGMSTGMTTRTTMGTITIPIRMRTIRWGRAR